MRLAISLILGALALLPASDQDDARRDAARSAGLRWLSEHQIREGHLAGAWECANPRYQVAVAALAGLALLADGRLPAPNGPGEATDRVLSFILARQDAGGYLGQGDPSGMYIHAIATLFCLSCVGMHADPERDRLVTEACRKALAVISDAQQVARPPSARGGWRYTPGSTQADVSVTSWQLLALHAGRQCGFPIDSTVIEEGLTYLDRAWREGDQGKGFAYDPSVDRKPETGATGAAIFIRTLLRGEADQRSLDAIRWLDTQPPAWGGKQYHGYFYFVSLYLAQARFQIGGETWTTFRSALEDILLRRQSGDGTWPMPGDNVPQLAEAGPAYPTALALLLLSLDRQYLPWAQRLDLP